MLPPQSVFAGGRNELLGTTGSFPLSFGSNWRELKFSVKVAAEALTPVSKARPKPIGAEHFLWVLFMKTASGKATLGRSRGGTQTFFGDKMITSKKMRPGIEKASIRGTSTS